MAATRSNMVLIFIFVTGLEPIMNLIFLLIARVPDLKTEVIPLSKALPGDLEGTLHSSVEIARFRTALVIPCQNSDRVAIKRVLGSE
jgi:hypothetical protein